MQLYWTSCGLLRKKLTNQYQYRELLKVFSGDRDVLIWLSWVSRFKSLSTVSLHQDITYPCNSLIAVVCFERSQIPTIVTKFSTITKSYYGVTITAVVFIVTQNTDSCSVVATATRLCIKPFLITVVLQGGLRTNQRLPRFTTQWGVAVLPISDQRVQGVRLLVDDNKPDLLTDLHAEADLREWCAPVGGKFGLLWVEPSLPSVKVEGSSALPDVIIVTKSALWKNFNSLVNWLI